MSFAKSLRSTFEKWSDCSALECGGEVLSFAELLDLAEHKAENWPHPAQRIAFDAVSQVESYVIILACLLSDRCFVPLPVKASDDRRQTMMNLAGVDLMEGVDGSQQVLPSSHQKEPLAYVMFTSGSTGVPKPVGVTTANLAAYLNVIAEQIPIDESARCSQLFELTFDLSVHDLLVSWMSGACVVVPSKSGHMNASAWAEKVGLSHMFVTPSMAAMAVRFGGFSAGQNSTLQHVLFCGEALPMSLARTVADAAPCARLHNLYGPTETTIAITAFQFPKCNEDWPKETICPIGILFPDHEMHLVEEGEMWLSGPQVTPGYLGEDKLAGKFACKDTKWWHRTGDRVCRTEDGMLHFKGRVDRQIKLRGHRVDLQQIESVMREAASGVVAAIAQGRGEEGSYSRVIGFACDDTDVDVLTSECRRLLPEYAVPSKIVSLPNMPLTASGKIDYAELQRMVSE